MSRPETLAAKIVAEAKKSVVMPPAMSAGAKLVQMAKKVMHNSLLKCEKIYLRIYLKIHFKHLMRSMSSGKDMERAKGVEPSSPAWEAGVMPLYDARDGGTHSKLECSGASMQADVFVIGERGSLSAKRLAAFVAVT